MTSIDQVLVGSTDASHFRRLATTGPISALIYGSDGAAIQAAIDVAIYNGDSNQYAGLKRTAYVPGAVYSISDTIHLGYGTTFNSVVAEGDGYSFFSGSGFNGTGITCAFDDRPAFNFQGSRGSVLRGIGIKGLNYDYLVATLTDANDTLAATWVDPAFPASADSRYAPYAGITVDAYSGVAPATAYPAVTYPAFLGAVAQYGKSYSSDILIEDVFITGFVAGVVNHPSDANSNGDFTQLRRVQVTHCKYGVSVGNTQSRNLGMDEVKMSVVHTAITNKVHGNQQGHLGGMIKNLSVSSVINLLDLGSTSVGGALLFTNFYGESLWRIGDISGTTASEQAVTFQESEFHFDHQTDARGVPATVLGPVGTTEIFFKFDGCSFSNFPSVLVMALSSVETERCSFSPQTRPPSEPVSASYLALAHNALSGGFVPHRLAGNLPARGIKYTRFNPTTLEAVDTKVASNVFGTSGRDNNIPLGVNYIYPASDNALPYPYSSGVFAVAKSSLASVTLTDKVLTFTYTGRSDNHFLLYGPDNGDILYDDQTGTVFFVRSRTGTAVTAEMQNNYKSDGAGGFDPITSFSTTVGNFFVGCSRRYALSYHTQGDTSSSSAVISSVGRDDGYAGFLDAEVAVGDALGVYDTSDLYVAEASRPITARSQAAGTITLTGNAARTLTRKRLEFFVRAAPANV